jgi:hypothetical protein
MASRPWPGSSPWRAAPDAGGHEHDVRLEFGVGVSGPGPPDRLLEFVEALACRGDRLDHGHAEQVLEEVAVYEQSLVARLVDHVQRHDRGQTHVQQLQREEQIPLEVDGVHHVDDRVGAEDDVSGHHLLVVEGGDAVDARRVDDVGPVPASARELDGGPREVGDIDIRTGQCVEEDRLADVGIAGQDYRPHTGGRRRGRSAVVVRHARCSPQSLAQLSELELGVLACLRARTRLAAGPHADELREFAADGYLLPS